MSEDHSLRAQLQRNAVAIISLVVAIGSLGYNTWRNERTEANRNVRSAGFALMNEIAGLQQVVFLYHYDMDAVRGNPRVGWTHVLAIRDLAFAMPDEVRAAAGDLYLVWQDAWQDLDDPSGLEQVDAAIERTKSEILSAIGTLD